MNINAIAQEVELVSEEHCGWAETDCPLSDRGISYDWLYHFVLTIRAHLDREWNRFDNQKAAAIHFDYVPEPSQQAAIPRNLEMTPELLVPTFIIPMTKTLKTPLFARIPSKYRGKPELFISHVWSQPLVSDTGFATLVAIMESMRREKKKDGRNPYVWIDIVCYNQHRLENVALDIKDVIKSTGQLCLPLIPSSLGAMPAIFSRLWCLWEILCAHITNTEIGVYELGSSANLIGYVYRCFTGNFQSVSEALTALPKDKEFILKAMISTFGSIEQADRHLRKLVEEGLTKDSDKPWKLITAARAIPQSTLSS